MSNKIKYSYNPAIIAGLAKDEAGKITNGWQFTEVQWELDAVTKMIHTHAYIASELENGYRSKSNVKAVYNIILDFDEGHPSFQDFITLAGPYEFSWVAHTTVNHQKAKKDSTGNDIPNTAVDKYRVIIPLREPISESEYEACKEVWLKRFPLIDTSSFEGSRYYMVNPNAEVHFHDYKDQTGDSAFFDPFEAGMIRASKKSKGINLAAKVKELEKLSFTPDLEVETSAGQKVLMGAITKHTPVICPFCNPADRQNPTKHNAFVDFNDKGKRFLSCSSENKTYWEVESTETIADTCEKFWSYNTSVYEAGMMSDVFSLENISEKKFYVKVGADSKEDKNTYFDYLVTNKHLHRLNRIDNTGDVNADETTFSFDQTTGNITVRVKALPVNIQDNDLIERYLESVFGQYKDFIKQWLAVYVYTNYVKLPTLIFTGDRGVGKNTFAQSIMSIFPALSVTANDLQNNFTPFAEKKLLVIDESDANGKVQYKMLKKFSGQKFLEVNKKYLPQYQVQNNLNIMLLSNDELPIYVERDEIPTDSRNNQFFVYKFQPHADFDAQLEEKIIDRLGHYVRSELRSVFSSLNINTFRYAIDTPITPEEQKLFNNSVTDIEAEADRLIEYIENKVTDPSWYLYKFTQAGIIPSSFFHETISSHKVNKTKVIQNLQKRGYLTNDPVSRYQIEKQRHYVYKLGPKVSVPKCLYSHFSQPTATLFEETAQNG